MVNRLMFWTCCVLVATAPVASAWGIETPTWRWTLSNSVEIPGQNPYYLNGNLDGSVALVGQIGFGGRWVDVNGNLLASVDTRAANMFPGHGAKSMVRIGDYYYISHDDAAALSGNLGRIDATGANARSADSWNGPIEPRNEIGLAIGPESLCSDGTYLFTNNDNERYTIHKYSIDNTTTPFSITLEWYSDLPDGGRVRGISYDAASGYLYMHNGGADTAHNTLYAIDGSTGASYNMGVHNEGAVCYQALRCNDQLLVAGLADRLTVYNLTSDTQIDPTPSAVYDLGVLDIYGLSRVGGTLYVASLNKLSAFSIYKPGDANYDGDVDDEDASIVGANWLTATGATWETGDFNYDGAVNDKDAAILAANWSSGGGGGEVPEPSTLAMLFGAAVMAWLVRRSR